MAIARIETCWAEPPDHHQCQQLGAAVADALIAALEVPTDDPTVFVIPRDPTTSTMPGHASDHFTVVTVTLYTGRRPATKKKLYTALVEALHGCGVPPSDALLVLDEVPMPNWGVHGGQPADTIDLDFNVDI